MDAKFWLAVGNYFVVFMVVVIGWWWKRLRNEQKASKDVHVEEMAAVKTTLGAEIEELKAEVKHVEHRLTLAESSIEHLPSRGDLGEVYEQMNLIHGDLKQVIGTQTSMSNSVQMITQHLMGDPK
ncbi:MAG: DUF2730 family protein [Ghiorsea sp.]|nr:DUF2730 family protein [Ghiorsea sp.]